MQEETAIESLHSRVQTRPDSLLVSLGIDMAKVLEAEQPVELGFAAVIKHKDGKVTHWATDHRGPQPDFHRRDGFTVRL
jgi:hypothetical protein